MLDKDLKPLLIEVNSNPSLEVDGSILGKIIPNMIENTLKIAVDPLYPPPYSENPKSTKFAVGNPFEQNKYELIYDSQYEKRFKLSGMDENQQMDEE